MTRWLREKDRVDADREALESLQNGMRVMRRHGLQDDRESAGFLHRINTTLDEFVAEGETYTAILRAIERFVEVARYPTLDGSDNREALGFVGTLLDAGRAQSVRP